MRPRAALELTALFSPFRAAWVLLLALGLALAAPSARADDEDPGHRFGLVPGLGAGLAGVVHPGPLPGKIGFTDLGVELLGELRPWGLYVRGDFLSSGDDGRWTAYEASVGTQYRLFGTTERTALFLRGGITYARWIGKNGGCPIAFVVPSSCNLLGATGQVDPSMPAPAPFSTTADMLGLAGGVRLELPLSAFYVAFDASFVPEVSVDTSTPSGVFGVRVNFEAGFRDTRRHTSASRRGDPDEYRNRR